MTAQSSDTLKFERRKFEVTDLSQGTLFDPTAYGFTPVRTSTGCHRGFECQFSVSDGQLFLQTLWINHGDFTHSFNPDGSIRSHDLRLLPMPLLNGISATEKYDNSRFPDFQGRYDGLKLPLSYTGHVLIAANRISNEPWWGGHRRAWDFHHSLMLSFEQGRLTARKDTSEILQVFDARYCTDGYLLGDKRRNGLRYIRRHIGHGVYFF